MSNLQPESSTLIPHLDFTRQTRVAVNGRTAGLRTALQVKRVRQFVMALSHCMITLSLSVFPTSSYNPQSSP
jgi:hypothetical protein